MIPVSLLNFLFCSCIFFPDVIILSVFPCSSLSFLKTNLSHLSGKLQISTSKSSVTEKLLCTFCGFMVPWFWMLLKVLHCCFHIWRSSHFFKSLLTGFSREIPSLSPLRDLESFSYLLWICLLHFLLPLEEGLLRLYTFSPSSKARVGSGSLPFAFPWVVLNDQVCVLSLHPTESCQLSACAH